MSGRVVQQAVPDRLLQYKRDLETAQMVTEHWKNSTVRAIFKFWAARIKGKASTNEIKKQIKRKPKNTSDDRTETKVKVRQTKRRSSRRPRMEEYCVVARPRKTKVKVKVVLSAKDSIEQGRCCGREPARVWVVKREAAKARAKAIALQRKSFKTTTKAVKTKVAAYFVNSTQRKAKKTKTFGIPGTPFMVSNKSVSHVEFKTAVVLKPTPKTMFRNFTNVNGKRTKRRNSGYWMVR